MVGESGLVAFKLTVQRPRLAQGLPSSCNHPSFSLAPLLSPSQSFHPTEKIRTAFILSHRLIPQPFHHLRIQGWSQATVDPAAVPTTVEPYDRILHGTMEEQKQVEAGGAGPGAPSPPGLITSFNEEGWCPSSDPTVLHYICATHLVTCFTLQSTQRGLVTGLVGLHLPR